MCGIAGIVGGDASRWIGDMVGCLSHRGPDDSMACALGRDVELGHTRLAIIDTSAAGRQPMQFGRWHITYNGEIYNYRYLRAHLETKGHAFTTQTDTEVLLHAWAEHGADCLHMLDGMFAFAVYNTETKELTLVRDRAGEKPLYYLERDGVFAFASELRALADLSERQVSQEALALYALYRYVPAPRSIWSDVRKLPPGCLAVADGRGVNVRRWWSWEVEPSHEVSAKGFREVCDAVDEAITSSVQRRLISDVPLGMFLSGGIDSSLVAATAARLGHTPQTFSIGFEGADSEHEQARAIARHLGTEHHEHVFGPSDFESVGRTIGDRLDEPNGDRSCVPSYLLAGFAKQFVTVALSGDGGDELFAGYGRYLNDKCGNPLACSPLFTISDYYEYLLPVYGWLETHDMPGAWHDALESAESLLQSHQLIHALRALDFNRYLPGCVLPKMDRMSMQHSLEVRTPYLEPQLMEIARKLPAAYLMNGQMGKLVLREIAGRYLPRDVALAPKRGFGLPKGVFAQNGKAMAEMYEEAGPWCERVGFPKPPNNNNAIWAYIVLGQWLRSVA
jgi:asparagine synthase (glutamine-hydrolysing)